LPVNVEGVVGLESRKTSRVLASPPEDHFLTPVPGAKGIDEAGSERDIGKKRPVEISDDIGGIAGGGLPLDNRWNLPLSIRGHVMSYRPWIILVG
jgi:hypothetical protein